MVGSERHRRAGAPIITRGVDQAHALGHRVRLAREIRARVETTEEHRPRGQLRSHRHDGADGDRRGDAGSDRPGQQLRLGEMPGNTRRDPRKLGACAVGPGESHQVVDHVVEVHQVQTAPHELRAAVRRAQGEDASQGPRPAPLAGNEATLAVAHRDGVRRQRPHLAVERRGLRFKDGGRWQFGQRWLDLHDAGEALRRRAPGLTGRVDAVDEHDRHVLRSGLRGQRKTGELGHQQRHGCPGDHSTPPATRTFDSVVTDTRRSLA